MPSTPLELVYVDSGSRKDKTLRDKLATFLTVYKRGREPFIKDWHSGEVVAGIDRNAQVEEKLRGADIILLLISADFIRSDDTYIFQMGIALEQKERGEAEVIPIILRACIMEGAPFAHLTALPKERLEDGEIKAVDLYENKDEVFKDIGEAIGEVIKKRIRAGPARIALPPKKPSIPKDLLLLCDRAPQQERVELVLEKKDMSRRPLVLVIHGSSDECLVEYKDRLKNISLPEFLSSQLPLEEYPVQLPSADLGYDYFPSIFQKNLAGSFDKRTTPLKDLAEIISKNPARVMIYSRLYSNEWDPQGEEQTDAFLSFWNNFSPPLNPGHRLVCCLLIIHKSGSSSEVENAKKARAFLKNLERPENLLSYKNREGKVLDNLYAVVLPELASVEESDAASWVEARHFRKLCRDHDPRLCNIRGALADIEARYLLAMKTRIPMKELLPQLEEVVSRYICKGT